MYSSNFTEHTRALAEMVDAEYEMVLIPIIANKASKLEFCYRNVAEKVKTAGGKQQYGWMVLQSPFTVEAVHHCVWEDPKGNLVDITPARIQLSHVLFIPDDRIAYDGRVIDSIKMNITNNHVVEDHILLDSMRNILIAQCPESQEGRRVMTHPLWPKYKKWNHDVMQFLFAGNTHSSPCYCNNGLPYARCHAVLLHDAIEMDKSGVADLVVRLETDPASH